MWRICLQLAHCVQHKVREAFVLHIAAVRAICEHLECHQQGVLVAHQCFTQVLPHIGRLALAVHVPFFAKHIEKHLQVSVQGGVEVAIDASTCIETRYEKVSRWANHKCNIAYDNDSVSACCCKFRFTFCNIFETFDFQMCHHVVEIFIVRLEACRYCVIHFCHNLVGAQPQHALQMQFLIKEICIYDIF